MIIIPSTKNNPNPLAKFKFVNPDKNSGLGDILHYTEEDIYKLIEQDPENILQVIKPTEDMCIKAVSTRASLLKKIRRVHEQTENICLATVSKEGGWLKEVIDQTEKICLAAVYQHPNALKYVQLQTINICLTAVTRSKSSGSFSSPIYPYVKIVPNPSHDETLQNLLNKKAMMDILNQAPHDKS